MQKGQKICSKNGAFCTLDIFIENAVKLFKINEKSPLYYFLYESYQILECQLKKMLEKSCKTDFRNLVKMRFEPSFSAGPRPAET